MRRYIIATALIASLGMLFSAIASPHRTATAAHALLANAGAAVKALSPAAQQSTSPRNSTLNRPRVSKLDNGRIVVAMESSGDIRGDMTLILDTNSDGTVSGGTWSLVSSYEVETGPVRDDGDGDAPHASGANFINNGTLTGSILSGSVALDADGTVTGLNGVQLEVKGGSLTFSDVSQGDGLVSGTNLSDKAAATGSLQLNF